MYALSYSIKLEGWPWLVDFWWISAWDIISARAEISAWLLKQILLKSNCRLHGEGFSPGRNSARAENPSSVFANWARLGFSTRSTHVIEMEFQPGLKILARFAQTGLGFSARANGPENQKKSHVIETEFQPGLKSGIWLLLGSRSDFSGIKAIK